MAGSPPATPFLLSPIPILLLVWKHLRQLADGLTDRVAVMDRDLNVVYANDAGLGKGKRRRPLNKPAKRYQAFVQMTDPCGACPAERVGV